MLVKYVQHNGKIPAICNCYKVSLPAKTLQMGDMIVNQAAQTKNEIQISNPSFSRARLARRG